MHGFSLHLESTACMGGGSLSQPVIGYKMDLKPMLCYFMLCYVTYTPIGHLCHLPGSIAPIGALDYRWISVPNLYTVGPDLVHVSSFSYFF